MFRQVLLAAFLALAVTQAWATEGFVIESNGANVAVGTAVEPGAVLAIPTGGHVVILTSSGQMLRRDGPFEGKARDAFDLGAPTQAKADILATTLDALMDLARDGGTGSQAFAGRTMSASGDSVGGGVFAIAVATKVYCHRPGATPVFALANPYQADKPITLDRYGEPAAYEIARWAADQRVFPWPEAWAPLREGSYEWTVGDARGEFQVKVLPADPNLGDLLDIAVALKDQGCAAQARAALEQAIGEARLIH